MTTKSYEKRNNQPNKVATDMDSAEAGLVQDFIDESAECLLTAERCLVASRTEDQQGEIQELFVFSTPQGNAALFGCEAMKLVAHDAEHLWTICANNQRLSMLA